MMKSLPQAFKDNASLFKLANQVQKSRCMTSSLCYKNPNTLKYHLIEKNQYAPLVMEDWQAYNIMRGWCDILFNTGSTIRTQKTVFKSYVSLGNPDIDTFFRNCHGKQSQKGKQWVYIATNTMKTKQLSDYVCEDFYTLMNGTKQMQQILEDSGFSGENICLIKLVKSLLKFREEKFKNNEKPSILLQFGTRLFRNYFRQVEQLNENPLDLIFLSIFQGKIHEKCIGQQITMKTDQYYDEFWRSEDILLNYPQRELQGKLNFILLKKKENKESEEAQNSN